MRGIGIGGESGSSGHTTPGSEGSLRGRFNWAPSGGLNGGSTAYVRNELINRVPRAVRTVRLRKPALQVQQGGIKVDKGLCMARGRVPVHISAHQISKSNRVTN